MRRLMRGVGEGMRSKVAHGGPAGGWHAVPWPADETRACG
jgi:hypothetical protein